MTIKQGFMKFTEDGVIAGFTILFGSKLKVIECPEPFKSISEASAWLDDKHFQLSRAFKDVELIAGS